MLISEDPAESCKGHTYPALNSCLGLDPREAIVIYGQMPPTDPTSGRVFSFSALGDIVNNVVMQQKSGEDPFGKARYFIITPSATTDHAVRSALRAMGVDNNDIFTEQIPSRDDLGPIGLLGMGKNAIDFITWFRYAVPDAPVAAKTWRSELPLPVLRVRPLPLLARWSATDR